MLFLPSWLLWSRLKSPKLFDKARLARWAKAVKKRDKKCLKCGSKRFLEAHHIIPKSQRPDLAFSLENGATLCKHCHRLNKNSWHKKFGYLRGGRKSFDKWLNNRRSVLEYLSMKNFIIAFLVLTMVCAVAFTKVEAFDYALGLKIALNKLFSFFASATR